MSLLDLYFKIKRRVVSSMMPILQWVSIWGSCTLARLHHLSWMQIQHHIKNTSTAFELSAFKNKTHSIEMWLANDILNYKLGVVSQLVAWHNMPSKKVYYIGPLLLQDFCLISLGLSDSVSITKWFGETRQVPLAPQPAHLQLPETTAGHGMLFCILSGSSDVASL